MQITAYSLKGFENSGKQKITKKKSGKLNKKLFIKRIVVKNQVNKSKKKNYKK